VPDVLRTEVARALQQRQRHIHVPLCSGDSGAGLGKGGGCWSGPKHVQVACTYVQTIL
jgi:hypothetical protein